jgi:hypothetical protein
MLAGMTVWASGRKKRNLRDLTKRQSDDTWLKGAFWLECIEKQWKLRPIVLDEVHQLPNPSELPKIAADHFSATQMLATGCPTLGAGISFRDTLAGRKTEL